jgi:membrane-bound lytic murein transglycosylase D
MEANNLKKASTLKVSQKLTIPGSGVRPRVAEKPSSRSAAAKPIGVSGGTVKYKVKKEDTLWTLANRYNTTVDALLAINNLSDSSTIRVGQTILVPKSNDSGLKGKGAAANAVDTGKTGSTGDSDAASVTYIVQKNDSLYVIAQKYGVSYRDIMQWNNIKDHRKIKPGDRLLIKTKG